MDYAKIAAEAEWLKANPHFIEKPASMEEFLKEDYLNIDRLVRPKMKEALIEIFGHEVNCNVISNFRRAMLTGGIGIGKTTFASIALPYMAHWVLCLKDPQGYFNLLPGSRIAFMQMSTSEKQALEVVFGDIFARIKHSPWFVENAPYDDKFTKQIRFPKDIWIIPGDSTETSFEGYNILGGILDEADSHKSTVDKDYADVGYDTINSRIESRFEDKGLLIVIGQMKKAVGFAAKKYKEFQEDPLAYTMRLAIWESMGWHRYLKSDGTRDSFYYDKKRKQIVPAGVAVVVTSEDILEIPVVYQKSFENNPEKALRDLAGIPPSVSDPFISNVDRIELAVEKWNERFPGVGSPVDDSPTRPKFASWFTGKLDPRRRTLHLDIAYSGNGDALGMAMGHVAEIVEIENELKPYIVFDFLLRMKAQPGTEIMLSDVRNVIYDLKEEFGFKLKNVTMDGFQSTDTMQQLRKRKFFVDYLSCDRSTLPYEDLREAINERRVEFPEYWTYINKGDTDRVQIAVKELMELSDTGKKIDHPTDGSKDVADAMAGVVSTLMGDRAYRKGVTSLSERRNRNLQEQEAATGTTGYGGLTPALRPDLGITGLQAPLPPGNVGRLGLAVPDRLQPRPER
jgi:hypothetical protein